MAKYISETIEDKTCVIVGTRPGIIKMSPLIDELQNRDVESFTIDAGQHYSASLSKNIMDDLRLPEPDYRVEEIRDTNTHGEQTAKMLVGIEKYLLKERPEYVLVCGDANFNLAGALATRKLRLTLGHVEAGLRSGDWRMPEEHNRVMIDHISDYLFAPTEKAMQNAREDNVEGEVIVTGNTVVDAVQRNLEIASDKSTILKYLNLKEENFVVFTAHREENVDNKSTLSDLISTLERTSKTYNFPIVYPAHPRTKKRLSEFDLFERVNEIESLQLIDPLDYLDFLFLLSNSKLVITDSGGIQEESCILNIPCITIRENTERPETVELGANIIAGTNPDDVTDAISRMLDRSINWKNPFGDGNAASRILDSMYN